MLGDLLNNDCDYDKVHDEPKEYMFTYMICNDHIIDA